MDTIFMLGMYAVAALPFVFGGYISGKIVRMQSPGLFAGITIFILFFFVISCVIGYAESVVIDALRPYPKSGEDLSGLLIVFAFILGSLVAVPLGLQILQKNE